MVYPEFKSLFYYCFWESLAKTGALACICWGFWWRLHGSIAHIAFLFDSMCQRINNANAGTEMLATAWKPLMNISRDNKRKVRTVLDVYKGSLPTFVNVGLLGGKNNYACFFTLKTFGKTASPLYGAHVAQSFSFALYFLLAFRRSSHPAENNHVKGNPQRAAETEAWKREFIWRYVREIKNIAVTWSKAFDNPWTTLLL